jgi:hypothetical protein
MGATDFLHYATGRTAEEAFEAAREEALYDYGHSGYTGTIAEKYEFVEFIPPPRVTADKVYSAAWQALDTVFDSIAGSNRTTRNTKAARAKLDKWFGPSHASHLLEIIDSKYTPAAAIRLSAKEAALFVPRTPTGKRKKNYHAWLFFGLAAN